MKNLYAVLLGLFLIPLNSNAQFAGNALDFDGVDDYIDCPLPAIFNDISNNDFTVELWANPDVGNFERLFFAELDDNNFASISLNSTGEVVFYLNENGVNHSVQSLNTLNPLEWAHIAVTWNVATQEAKIFLNGEEAMYAGGLYVSSTGTDGKMAFGSKTDGTQNFNGEMDELAIWDFAKSECENRFQMNDKKSGAVPNIVATYIFDSGNPSGANPSEIGLPDLSPFSYSGNLMNFALSGTSSNWILSNANVFKVSGAQSQVWLGQLGLNASLSANSYQWIYCPSGVPVPGATNSTFDPPTEDPNYDGNNDLYAVVSVQGNCVDTSLCYVFNNVNVEENDLESMVSIFPNPSQGVVSIESELEIERIEIFSITGELMNVVYPISIENQDIQVANENGFYLVVLHTSAGLLTKKILVQNK